MTTPYSNRPKVTQADTRNGFVIRYFVRNISTKAITEIDLKQYEVFKRNVLYQTIQFQWVISGFANDILSTDNKIIYGTRHRNTVTTDFYEKKMPGLKRVLRNPLEYFQGVINPVVDIPPPTPTYSSEVGGGGGTFVPIPIPTPPTSSTTYTALDITGGELSYYLLRSDNSLWSWGYNGSGELGIGNFDDTLTPTQVAGSWESISAGAYSLLAIKTDNTLWATGLNWDGRLGLGDETDRNTMTQVSGTGWEKVSTAIGYGDHTLGLKTDGTLWAWGGNAWGQLGTGSSGSDQLTPVQVGSDTNWAYVHAAYDRSFALKTNGTLWSWGSNLSTALGQGDSDPGATYTTPTQVGTDTNWTKLSSGWAFTLALKSNGTLWVTGTNYSYELGVGSTDESLEYNTFTQVGSDTDWADISCGYQQAIARKTDGSIYTWGYNADGELGLGDTTNRASPTQVGSDTNWTDISGGFYDALAVKNNTLTYWGWNFDNYLGTGNEPQLTPTSLSYSSTLLY
jgi:alpha-tubulin suppressor-like RCC1 family protein